MVRLKNRYLLVNILYPGFHGKLSLTKVPDLVSFNQPTTDDLTPNLLIKAIRSEVAEIFGDYGSGAIADSLSIKYLSPATSTFIIRVSRAHYRIAWAALSFMNTVPVKNGRSCIFQVVRVSGTIRKAEEAAIRSTREMILRARQDLSAQSHEKLDTMLGKPEKNQPTDRNADVLMVDRSDSEGREEEISDGDG